ncbi:hypothetical protein EPH95_10885 [Salicibibacter halophilus]|uniref:acylphosphatase n=1 Tax=Salicibibacter halophilus TaxID=2502791 RepID=A0A514LID1_9BACI|nr:acylphosphatase [Salicibibacter halophilus]QDI91608.1 hypothetical protein EPH95_10885 [Salicibibacter halophilus]
MIKIDLEVKNLIQDAGYTLDSVPKDGERIFLREQSNLSNGGDSLDVTDELTPEMRQIAIDATRAVPGLAQSGVDLLVDQDKSNSGTVIEINSRPGLGGHLFPVEGEPRDFAKAFIDYYFPETKDIERSNLYFNFNKVLVPLKSKTANSVEVTAPPLGKLYGKRYIVSGKVQGVGYRKWIKYRALRRSLHGYAKNLKNGSVEVVVAGAKERAVNNFKDLCLEGPAKAEVEQITEEEWDKPIKMGFYMKSSHTKKKVKNVHKEYDRVLKEYNKIKNSKAWRATYPVRATLDVIKRIIKR